VTAQDARDKYLAYLKDDIQHGLAIKRPRIPEKLTYGHTEVLLDLPFACFTEWSLNESEPHTSRYGRMALGFSKCWIIKHGGQPITYFNHIQKGLFLRNALELYEFVETLKKTVPRLNGLKANVIETAFQHARYILHFAKSFAPAKEKVPPKRKRKSVVPKPSVVKRTLPQRPATRYYGQVLEYLEEREWRIVRHKKAYFTEDSTGQFDSRLRFKLGAELFTLVLPDNELVRMVWRDEFLRERLLKADVPVTVLSLREVGTF